MRSFITFICFSMVLITGLACVQKFKAGDDGYIVRIPVDNGSGDYSLQDAHIRTAKELQTLSGDVVQIQVESRLEISAEEGDTKAKVDLVPGHSATAQFILDGDVHIPANFKSLALSAVAFHFENIKSFYDSFEANKELEFPRTVHLDIDETLAVGKNVQVITNNAAYFPSKDTFLINPYLASNIPIAINGGVLAHEYLHSIFDRKLKLINAQLVQNGKITSDQAERNLSHLAEAINDEWSIQTNSKAKEPPKPDTPQPESNDKKDAQIESNKKDSDKFDKDAKRPEELTPDELEKANKLIFRAINEAVADYFAYEYTRNPKWLIPSLPEQTSRDLSQPKTLFLSVQAQKEWIKKEHLSDDAAGIDEHALGSYFAYFLYKAANSIGAEQTRKDTLEFMKKFSEEYSSQNRNKFFSLGQLTVMFFQGKQISKDLCTATSQIFPDELTPSSFPCVNSEAK